jgi:hypothetical protein
MAITFNRGKDRKPEAIFASAVMKQLKALYGIRMWETAFPGGLAARSGIPDRLICIDGKFVAIEFKNPAGGGRLGPKQKLELEALKSSGAIALVVSSAEDLDELFEEIPPTQRLMAKISQIEGKTIPKHAQKTAIEKTVK